MLENETHSYSRTFSLISLMGAQVVNDSKSRRVVKLVRQILGSTSSAIHNEVSASLRISLKESKSRRNK